MENMEQGPSKSTVSESESEGYEVYDSDMIRWLNTSIDTFAHMKAFQQLEASLEAPLPEHTLEKLLPIIKQARMLLASLEKLEAFDQDMPLSCFSLLEKGKKYLNDCTTFFDALGFQMAKITSSIEEHQRNLFLSTKNLHRSDDEDSWKATLDNASSLDDVLSKAGETLGTLDGKLVATNLKGLEQVFRPQMKGRWVMFCYSMFFASLSPRPLSLFFLGAFIRDRSVPILLNTTEIIYKPHSFCQRQGSQLVVFGTELEIQICRIYLL